MMKLPLISKDIFSGVDYSKFTDYNSGWKEVIERRQHFATTYKVPTRLFKTYISAVKQLSDGDKDKDKKRGVLERNFYLGYWEDIFTHFPFIPSCRINVFLNDMTHKFLLFKAGE